MSQGGIAARTLTLMRGSKTKKKQNTPHLARIVPGCYDRHTHVPTTTLLGIHLPRVKMPYLTRKKFQAFYDAIKIIRNLVCFIKIINLKGSEVQR